MGKGVVMKGIDLTKGRKSVQVEDISSLAA